MPDQTPQYTKDIVAASHKKVSLLQTMAERYGLEPLILQETLKKTIFPSGKEASNEQMASFLIVANQYNLNPFTKEIYAFPSKSGGITPVVGVDGWSVLVNRHPQMDGVEFTTHEEKGVLISVSCSIFRKDRKGPCQATEYYQECKRNTEPWNTHPRRMLRHKAFIQAARMAFGITGIYDPDEAERIRDTEARTVTVDAQVVNEPTNPTEQIKKRARKKLEEAKKEEAPEDTLETLTSEGEPMKQEREPGSDDDKEEADLAEAQKKLDEMRKAADKALS